MAGKNNGFGECLSMPWGRRGNRRILSGATGLRGIAVQSPCPPARGEVRSGKFRLYCPRIPYAQTFNLLPTRLSQDEFDRIVEYIDGLIDKAGGEIVTAGWLPKGPKRGEWPPPLLPIYDIAARKNYDLAGKMFGLMVWYTIMQRPERWGSMKCERNGIPIRSRTYFRV